MERIRANGKWQMANGKFQMPDREWPELNQSLDIRDPRSVIRHVPSGARPPASAIRHLPFVIWRPASAIWHLPSGIWHLASATRNMRTGPGPSPGCPERNRPPGSKIPGGLGLPLREAREITWAAQQVLRRAFPLVRQAWSLPRAGWFRPSAGPAAWVRPSGASPGG